MRRSVGAKSKAEFERSLKLRQEYTKRLSSLKERLPSLDYTIAWTGHDAKGGLTACLNDDYGKDFRKASVQMAFGKNVGACLEHLELSIKIGINFVRDENTVHLRPAVKGVAPYAFLHAYGNAVLSSYRTID